MYSLKKGGELHLGEAQWKNDNKAPDIRVRKEINGVKKNIVLSRKSEESKAFKVALGGICSAVCLLMMFCSSFFPGLSYTIPIFAGFLMVVMIVECSSGWALATYCAVSLLCIFITPNYEASLLFILFMGYYPILKIYLDKHRIHFITPLIKWGVFNLAIVIYYNIFTHIFTTVDMLEDMEMFGKYALLVLWGMAQLCFFVYERCLTVMTEAYIKWFRKKILRRK